MWDLTDEDLEEMKRELQEDLQMRGIHVTDLSVSAPAEFNHIEATGTLVQDRRLPKIPGQTCDRRISFTISGLVESPDTGQQVYWGELNYSVPSGQSFFSPVSPEYGSEIAIRFGWEFDPKTFQPSYADVRERKSIHYVSVLPSEELSVAVQCFASVLNSWFDESGDE